MQERVFFVYILASRYNGTLYIGMTSDLPGRIWLHKNHVPRGFTDTYNVTRLVYAEPHGSAESAMLREMQMKKWRRAWKIQLIETENPTWRDLYDEIAEA